MEIDAGVDWNDTRNPGDGSGDGLGAGTGDGLGAGTGSNNADAAAGAPHPTGPDGNSADYKGEYSTCLDLFKE
jgi:hypothetical protein